LLGPKTVAIAQRAGVKIGVSRGAGHKQSSKSYIRVERIKRPCSDLELNSVACRHAGGNTLV
jgi:hypothetical protein